MPLTNHHAQAIAVFAVLISTACGTQVTEPRGFVSPYDGQTRVALDRDLVIRTGGIGFPEHSDLPQDAISVVDLADGTFVPGEVWRDGDDLVFTPNQAWKPDANYSWNAREPRATGRSPQLEIPNKLRDLTYFSTELHTDILGASVNEQGELCLLFSRYFSRLRGQVSVGIAGSPLQPFGGTLVQERDLENALPLGDQDLGMSFACSTIVVEEGAEIAVTIGQQAPWEGVADALTLDEMASHQRHATW